MTDLQTIKSWFRTRCKPTQAQFWETFDSFWHKAEGISVTAINGLMDILNSKAAADHNHDGVYQPAGNYAAADHNHDNAYAPKNHTHDQYLTEHQDISGKQDVITDLATIRNNATMAAVRAYTLDFGTGAELIQDVNMLGAITINRIDVLNVAHLYVTYGNVSHQEIDLTQPVSLSVADGVIITWEIVRSIEDGLACVGVCCNINPSNNA